MNELKNEGNGVHQFVGIEMDGISVLPVGKRMFLLYENQSFICFV